MEDKILYHYCGAETFLNIIMIIHYDCRIYVSLQIVWN